MKLSMKIDFQDKVVVITGAGGVIGSALAEAFAESGARTALLDLNGEAAEEKAEGIRKKGLLAKGYPCNVLEKESCERAREEIKRDFGTCDVLINGAGGNHPKATTEEEYFRGKEKSGKTFFDLDISGISFVFDLNFLGTVIPSQVFGQDMAEKKGSCILNISSMNAFTPLTKIPAYSGAKAAVSNFTKWLAVYFSKSGIRCNAIAPGFFVTKQNEGLLFEPDGRPTARTDKILRSTPMERFGKVEELVGAALFLTSEQTAGFVTGVVLPIDGGFSAYSGV